MRSIVEGWRQTFLLPERFETQEMEEAFHVRHCARFADMRVGSGTLGVLTWLGYLALDVALSRTDPDFTLVADRLMLYRFLVTPFLAIFIVFALTERFRSDERFASALIMAGSIAMATFSAWAQLVSPFPYNYIYYFHGFTVALTFCVGMFRLSARQLALLLVLVATVAIGATWYPIWFHGIGGHHVAYAWPATFLTVTISVVGYGIGVQLENAERDSFLAQLRLRHESEQRNRDKSRFLASAVHDLKQPLQAISNALHPVAAAFSSGDVDKANGLTRLAQAATVTMHKQLEAILDISRLESGLIAVNLSIFNLAAQVNEIVAQQFNVATEAGVTLSVAGDDTHANLPVRSDEAFVERILTNLIGNAIKYRDPQRDSWVAVSVLDRGSEIAVAVSDNGIGISEQHLAGEMIFQPFFQINNRYSESRKGVGLGLSIVRAMIDLLPDHRIEVNSTIGVGSTFTLILPRAQSPSETESAKAAGIEVSVPPRAGSYVLLVEDDTLVRETTAALLDAYGVRYEAYASFEAFEAGIAALDGAPDLVLTDFRLPEQRTAVDVIRLATERLGTVGIIVFSGEVGRLEELNGLPIQSILRKPLSPKHLLDAIADAVQGPARAGRNPVVGLQPGTGRELN